VLVDFEGLQAIALFAKGLRAVYAEKRREIGFLIYRFYTLLVRGSLEWDKMAGNLSNKPYLSRLRTRANYVLYFSTSAWFHGHKD
jgi:hypothetical protein